MRGAALDVTVNSAIKAAAACHSSWRLYWTLKVQRCKRPFASSLCAQLTDWRCWHRHVEHVPMRWNVGSGLQYLSMEPLMCAWMRKCK